LKANSAELQDAYLNNGQTRYIKFRIHCYRPARLQSTYYVNPAINY